MSISKGIAYAVFASTCFIIGFFSGQWATYDEKQLNVAYEHKQEISNQITNLNAFMRDTATLSILKKSHNAEFLSEMIKNYEHEVTWRSEYWKKYLQEPTYAELQFSISNALKLSNEVLNSADN